METIFHIAVVAALFLVLAAFSFFLAASEMSVIALSRIRLRHMVEKGVRRAQNIQRLITKMDKFIIAILVGNSFANIAMSAVVTAIFVKVFGFNWGVIVATFVSTFFILIFCEITPKLLATKHTEKIALVVSPLMEKIVTLLDPVIAILTVISNGLLRILRIQPAKRSPLITEEELRLMIEIGKEEGFLSDEERKMLHRIFEFGDIKISEVMIPKEKIIAVSSKTTPEELLNIFVEEGHARLPVYEKSADTIVGIIYARDLLYTLRDKGLFLLQDLIHEAYFAPASMRVSELLRKFQVDKIQIAIVVDKDKKTLGLVTLEDLIEEIVGELEEEHVNHRTNKH